MMEKSQEQDLCITKEVDQHKPNCGEAMPFDSRENHISKTSQDQATKYHYLMTMSLCGGFLVFGFSLSALGLSLPTLAYNLNVSIDKISSLVIARGAGYLLGSIISGFLSKYVCSYLLLLSAKLLMIIGLVCTPVTLNVVGLFVFTVMNGAGMSAFETIGNVAALQMWGEKSEPVIQLLHFWFSVGAAVMPFIMIPFINEANYSINETISNNSHLSASFSIQHVGASNLPLISIPYFLMGFVLLFLFVFEVLAIPSSFMRKSSSKQKDTVKYEGIKFRAIMLVFLFFLYLFYVGWGVSFSAFLFSFGLSDASGMNLSKDTAVYLNTALFFSVVFGQFLAIFMSKKFSPSAIIVVDLAGMAVSATLMGFLPLYGDRVPQLFWLGVGGTGVFCASIYGTTFLWAERYITVNARAASVFIIGGSTGEMILPLPVGLLIERFPLSFLYLNIGYICMVILLFVIMWKVAETKGQRLKNLEGNSEEKSHFKAEART